MLLLNVFSMRIILLQLAILHYIAQLFAILFFNRKFTKIVFCLTIHRILIYVYSERYPPVGYKDRYLVSGYISSGIKIVI